MRKIDIKPTTKRYLASAAIAVVMIAGTVGMASAHMNGGFAAVKTDFAKAIATRFNLNQTEVETFLTEQETLQRTQMMAAMQAKIAEHLTQAVTDGKITEAQKQLIIAKHTEMQSKMTDIKNMTDQTAREAAMKAMKDDLTAWATANKIPADLLGGGIGRGFDGDHFGGPRMRKTITK